MPYQEIDDQGNPVVGDDGNPNVIDNPGSWDLIRNMIPEELQKEKFWESVPDTQTLLKNYAHAQKFQGQAVRIPGEGATPEDWAKFYSRLGRPEAPDGYEVKLPEIRSGWNEELVNGFKSEAHRLGLTPAQVQGILNFYGPAVDSQLGQIERSHEKEKQAATQALREKYGAAYDQKLAIARAALEHYADEGLMARLKEAGLLNDANFIEMFAGIGEILREDNYIVGHVEGIMTSEAAQEELEKIQGDLQGPYWDETHPNHKETVQKAHKLFQLIYPEPAKRE